MKKLLFVYLGYFALSAATASAYVPSRLAATPAPRYSNAIFNSQSAETDIYNATMLCEEDFSKFALGSEAEPDTTLLDGFISDLTQAPGWSAYGVRQAGGCALIDFSVSNNANLCSPVLDIPLNGKPVVVTFKAKLADPEYNFDWAQVYFVDVTDPTSPKTFFNEYAYSYNEWRDYKFVFDKKRTATQFFFRFSGYDASLLVDDIEIKFLDPKIEAPVATSFTDFAVDGFTAHWQPVEGADSYLVNLFTVAKDRDKTRTYILRDQAVADTCFTFKDIDTSLSTFYYTVTAVAGETLSPESNAVKVNGLVIPTNISIAPTDEGTLKIAWDAVPGTEYYEIIAERSYEATSDMEYVIADENFDNLVSYGSYTHPEELMSIYEELDDILVQPGWIAQNPVHINGAYGLVGYYYQMYRELAYLESPTYDLSAGNGDVTVSVDLYGQPIDELDECKAVIRLIKYVSDEETEVLSSYRTPELTTKWTNFETTLSDGSTNTAVEICSTAGYLYINNILITQQLKAGDKVRVPYISLKSEKNEIELPVHQYLLGGNFIIRLRAVREIWDSEHFSIDEYVRSPYTDETSYAVPSTAAVDDVVSATDTPKAFVQDNQLIIINPDGAEINVFDSLGHRLSSDRSHCRLVTLPLTVKGVMVVRVGETVLKVIN